MKKVFFCKKAAVFTLAACIATAVLSSGTVGAADKTLQSSDTLYHDISYEDELAEAAETLSLGDLANVTTKLVLPYSYGIHVNIKWESSDESVIDLNGNVVTPEDQDKDVTLKATLSSTKTDQTETKEFQAHVPKASVDDILNQDAKEAQEYIDYIINDGYKLPDQKELGIRSEIHWELTSGEANLKDGVIEKNENSKERQPLTLKATLKKDGQTKEVEVKNIVLLDQYAAYILSYFAGKNESKEMYLGYSYDGVHWMRLNQADAVLTPKKGVKQIRDPFIMRKKDGSFAIFATNGWSSPMISIWDSENLETFENERLCKLAEKGGVSSGFHTWAPECNYDPITDQYYVYWSDPDANGGVGQIYYNTTPDLEQYSQAGVFFEREFFVIDASIKKYKGDYYMVYDDATGDNDTGNGGRRIYPAKADSLEAGAFYPYGGVLSEGVAEGPFLFQNFKDGSWFAYYDYYSQHKFGYTTIDDITSDNWEYQGICESMPWEEVRHGGVILVTAKELDKILAKWGLDKPEVSEIKAPQEIKAVVGDKPEELDLPNKVSVLLSDGNIIEASVEWEQADAALEEEGTVSLKGELKDKDAAFENIDDLQPELKIVITKKSNNIIIYIAAGLVILAFALVAVGVMLKKRNNKK